MEKYILTYKAFGENALLIEWPPRIEEEILYDIIKFQQVLEKKLAEIISEFIPAYQSLTLYYNPELLKCGELISSVKLLYNAAVKQQPFHPKLWHIPVCYDGFFGIDQDEVSHFTKLPVEKIIELHVKTVYTIYFIGFLPGFLYLGGLHEALYIPRKSFPSSKIPRGSVAIGGNQTGIYPQENPGGWHVIGNSPISFLDINKQPPVFATPGDKVLFSPIDRDEHGKISNQINEGIYKLKMEIITP